MSASAISIILPATDETYSLLETVRKAKQLLPNRTLQFLIVTSPKLTSSACRETITKLQGEFGASVEAFDQTRPGIGGAIRDAFEKCTGSYAVLMAADLETDPAVLPALIKELDSGKDIAATTRWRRGMRFQGYSPVKLVLNFLFQNFFRILYWTKLTDLTYAYRAYRTDILKRIRWEETRFPFLLECIVKPLRLGYKVTEVEAPWRARTEGISHNSFKQTLDYTWVAIRVRFLPKSRILY